MKRFGALKERNCLIEITIDPSRRRLLRACDAQKAPLDSRSVSTTVVGSRRQKLLPQSVNFNALGHASTVPGSRRSSK